MMSDHSQEAEVVVLHDHPTSGVTSVEVEYLLDRIVVKYGPPTIWTYVLFIPILVLCLSFITFLVVIIILDAPNDVFSVLMKAGLTIVALAIFRMLFRGVKESQTFQITIFCDRIEFHRRFFGIRSIKTNRIDSVFVYVQMMYRKLFPSINLGLGVDKSGSRRPRSFFGAQCIGVSEANALTRIIQMTILLERVSELTGIPIRRDGRLHCSSGRYYPWPL